MSEHKEEPSDKSGRLKIHKEKEQKGSPAQTGPGTGRGMGTEVGSGWAPKGDRFGEEGGGADHEPKEAPEHESEQSR